MSLKFRFATAIGLFCLIYFVFVDAKILMQINEPDNSIDSETVETNESNNQGRINLSMPGNSVKIS